MQVHPVFGHRDPRSRVGSRSHVFHQRCKRFVHDRHGFGVQPSERCNFGIGSVHKAYRIDKPSRTVGSGIELRLRSSVLTLHDNVFRVEHVVHADIHFSQIPLNQILVTAQFGPVVSTHRTVEVRGRRIVERTDGHVQHAETQLLVGQYLFVGFRRTDRIMTLLYEFVAAQVTQVHRHHVSSHQQRQYQHEAPPFDLLPVKQQHRPGRQQHEHQ